MSQDFPTLAEVGEENLRSRCSRLRSRRLEGRRWLFAGYGLAAEMRWKQRREELRKEEVE